MPRVKGGTTTRKRHKKWLKMAKGYYGARSKLYRTARNAVTKALQYSYRDRRVRKREFRKLWITRINAAVRPYGLSYSKFIYGLKKANISINRKNLSELAIHHPDDFAFIVEKAKAALQL